MPDAESRHQHAIKSEPHKFTVLHQPEHPLACHATRNKSGQKSDNHRLNGYSRFGRRKTSFHQVEKGFAQYRDYHHEERETGDLLFFIAQHQSRRNGRTRTRKTRQHGTSLRQSYDERIFIRNFFFPARPGIVSKRKQQCRNDQHYTDQQQAVPENTLYRHL